MKIALLVEDHGQMSPKSYHL